MKIMDQESIKKITDEITEMLLRKNQDYEGASFGLGLNRNMVHLWDKVNPIPLELAKDTFNENNIEVVLALDTSISLYGLRNEFTQALLNILASLKDNLIQKVSLENKRYIFIDLFQKDDKNYLLIKDNSGESIYDNDEDFFDQSLDSGNLNKNSKTGLYMTKIIIEKHTKGFITFKNVEFTYKDSSYKGSQFTIILE